MTGVCSNTGLDTEECRCLDCQPETLVFSEIIGKPETIEDLLKGLNMPMNLRFRLLTMERDDYFIDRITSDHIVFKRLSRDGHYWMRCDCGNIVHVPIGKSWKEYCKKCNPQVSSSTTNNYTRITVFIIAVSVPICIGILWIVGINLGILPALEWPLNMVPFLMLAASGLTLFIWFEADQYRLKKKRKKIRKQKREISRV